MPGPITFQHLFEISAEFDFPFAFHFMEYSSKPAEGEEDDNGVFETVAYRSVGGSVRVRPISFQNEEVILFSPYAAFGFSRSTPWMHLEEGGDLEAIPELRFWTFDPGFGGLTAVRLGPGSHKDSYLGVTYALMFSAYKVAQPQDCPEDQIDRYGNCEDTSREREGGIPVPVHPPLFPAKGPHFTGRFGFEFFAKLLDKKVDLGLVASGDIFIRTINVEGNPDANPVHSVSWNFAVGPAVSF